LYDTGDTSEGLTRNLVGGALIALGAVVAILLFVIRRPKKRLVEEADE
jgi:hypothetical protein